MNSTTRRLYVGLFILIAASFATVNLIGYGLKWMFFPVHLKEGVLWEFYNNVKQRDIEHAIELLSPPTEILNDPQGTIIGFTNDPYFWSFEEFSLSEIDTDREVRGEFHLTNGATLKVQHGKIVIVPGEKSYPWNTIQFVKLGQRERIATITAYLRAHTDDYWAWFHGTHELSRILGREISATVPTTMDKIRDEMVPLLNGLP
jgi:hypothetical protein